MFGTPSEIIFIVFSAAVGAALVLLFFQNRRGIKVVKSLERLIIEPERAKISDAQNVLSGVMDPVIAKIAGNFESMAAVLARHIVRAEGLEQKLSIQNKTMVRAADAAGERISNMVGALENLIKNLADIMGRDGWKTVAAASEKFNDGAEGLLKELESRANSITGLSSKLDTNIKGWSLSGRKLSDELSQTMGDLTDKINMMSVAVKGMNGELSDIQGRVTKEFEEVRGASAGIENVLANNTKLLGQQLEKMEAFADQSRKLLQTQVNTMSDTAARIGTDIRLAESSIGTGADNLNDTVEKLFDASNVIKKTFDSIAAEIMDVRSSFQREVGEFSKTVVDNLQAAETATAHTMENAGQIAAEFKDSLVPMLGRINETVKGLENAEDRIRPLADLMRGALETLPLLTDESDGIAAGLTRQIDAMAGKIGDMKAAAADALKKIGDSAILLEKLTGESRQQMIDLVDDYTRAAKQVREISESAPAAAVSSAPNVPIKMKVAPARVIPVQDFTKMIEGIMEKLHELSVDLTRSIGAEIPDSVMNKYNNGDRAIFSKWFAKMISSADKKRVKDMFRSDAVFRTQATHFVHGFAKMVAGAERTDNREMVVATLLKTDLGIMYQALKACL